MKSCSTPNVYTLIIETRLDDKPSNMFIPTIIVSKDESALVERMIKTFTFSLDRLESSDGVSIIKAYMNTTRARIDYRFRDKNRSVCWDIRESELI